MIRVQNFRSFLIIIKVVKMVATMVGGVTMKIPEYLITFKVYYL